MKGQKGQIWLMKAMFGNDSQKDDKCDLVQQRKRRCQIWPCSRSKGQKGQIIFTKAKFGTEG